MATDYISNNEGQSFAGTLQAVSHPLAPLTSHEISTSAQLIRSLYPTGTEFIFKTISLREPAKKDVVPFLEAERSGRSLPTLHRVSFVWYYLTNTDKYHEAFVNLSTNKVESNVRLGPHVHGPGDGAEIVAVEKAVLEDESVKAEIAKLQLPAGTVIISDPWIYGKIHELNQRFSG